MSASLKKHFFQVHWAPGEGSATRLRRGKTVVPVCAAEEDTTR